MKKLTCRVVLLFLVLILCSVVWGAIAIENIIQLGGKRAGIVNIDGSMATIVGDTNEIILQKAEFLRSVISND